MKRYRAYSRRRASETATSQSNKTAGYQPPIYPRTLQDTRSEETGKIDLRALDKQKKESGVDLRELDRLNKKVNSYTMKKLQKRIAELKAKEESPVEITLYGIYGAIDMTDLIEQILTANPNLNIE